MSRQMPVFGGKGQVALFDLGTGSPLFSVLSDRGSTDHIAACKVTARWENLGKHHGKSLKGGGPGRNDELNVPKSTRMPEKTNLRL